MTASIIQALHIAALSFILHFKHINEAEDGPNFKHPQKN